MIDIRFPTALQMLLTLAHAEQQGQGQMTSAQLAYGLGAAPSLVRKLLVPLSRNNLVRSTLGKNGGVRLGKEARDISLRDIYAAVTEDKRLMVPRPDVPHLCDVSSHVEEFFEVLAMEAEQAVLTTLGKRSLDDGLSELLKLKKTRHCGRDKAVRRSRTGS